MKTYQYIQIIALAFLLSIGQEAIAIHKYNPVPKKKSIVIKKSRKPRRSSTRGPLKSPARLIISITMQRLSIMEKCHTIIIRADTIPDAVADM